MQMQLAEILSIQMSNMLKHVRTAWTVTLSKDAQITFITASV